MFKFREDHNEPPAPDANRREPEVCGGTDTTVDESAPKEIKSQEMILFDVTSALPIGFVSAFAAPTKEGTFLFLETAQESFRRGESNRAWALVKENIFPSLVLLVREENLADGNGRHSFTHGLPENFGGRVKVDYLSGERISFSCNQSPILSRATGERIAAFFTGAMKGERVPLPDIDHLTAIRFNEERTDGGFTRATLSINADGSGRVARSQRFSDSTVYESERTVSADALAKIKQTVTDCGLLAWATLPENGYRFENDKSLTFIFTDGEITVPNGRVLPDQLGGAFFEIELELTRS